MHKSLWIGLAGIFFTGCLGLGKGGSLWQSKPPMGYSGANPLPMASIRASYDFLDRLRTQEGQPVRYRRVGSVLTESARQHAQQKGEGILDVYELSDDAGGSVRLWLNPYAGHTTTTPPDGFSLAPTPSTRK